MPKSKFIGTPGTAVYRIQIMGLCAAVGGMVFGGVASPFVPLENETFAHLGAAIGAMYGYFTDAETF